MKLGPAFVLLVALASSQSVARADPPRSQILLAGTGKERPRPGDHVVVYASAIDAQGRPAELGAYFPMVARVEVGTPGGDVLAQMVVGEKRRYRLPPGSPGGAETVIDIELVTIAGARAPDRLPLPPPRAARRLANGLAYIQTKPGTGKKRPALTDAIEFRIGHTDSRSRDMVKGTIAAAGAATPADIPYPAVRDALRTMVAGEEGYFWIPPEKNAGLPMILQLTLVSVDTSHLVVKPGPLAGPPKKARRTKSRLPYVILRRGRTHPPRVHQQRPR